MKITIHQDEKAAQTEITVVCKSIDAQLQEILSYISLVDNTITGKKDDETFFIPLKDVMYFESVDNRVFFYTDDDCYETMTKLYLLEEKLQNLVFARISKSMIVNLKKMKSIKPEKNQRLRATLLNGEKLLVSRLYIDQIKERLGV